MGSRRLGVVKTWGGSQGGGTRPGCNKSIKTKAERKGGKGKSASRKKHAHLKNFVQEKFTQAGRECEEGGGMRARRGEKKKKGKKERES